MKNFSIQRDGRYDFFLLLSLAILALNIVSQVAAFPLQCLLLIYAVIKSDIRLFPGMFLLMLDKSNFKLLEATAVKFNIGFAVSPQNVFLIVCFFYCIIGIFRKWYDGRTLAWFAPWFLSVFPALAIALPAKRLGLTAVWQVPLVDFLTPAFYFWGIGVAKTWDEGRDYFITRMIPILAVLNALSLLRIFYVFGFAEHILMIALFVGAIVIRLGILTKIIGAIGSIFALGVILLLRYFIMEEAKGFAETSDVGSSFTTIMIGLLGCLFLWYFRLNRMVRATFKSIPYLALVFCLIVFVYATSRAGSHVEGKTGSRDYRNIIERFEFKLVGDRGMLWRASLESALRPPLVFRRLETYMQMCYNFETKKFELMPEILPHNQVLTQLVRNGWWLGLTLVLFLWWMHIRAFNAASDMLWDKGVLLVLLAPYAAVFIPVGLTGQSVLDSQFCSNALVTMIFPGIIYGIWQNRRGIGVRL